MIKQGVFSVRKILVVMNVAVLFMLFSCSNSGYLIYTSTTPYSDLQDKGIDINDGLFDMVLLTDEEYDAMDKSSMEFHHWTHKDIRLWLVGHGFLLFKSRTVANFITTERHCLVYVRIADNVYTLIK